MGSGICFDLEQPAFFLCEKPFELLLAIFLLKSQY